MIWLEAALAFALTMTVLATLVTMLMEVGYRVFLTREKGLELMMERLFDNVLWPRVAHHFKGAALQDVRQKSLDAITCNPVASTRKSGLRMWARFDPKQVPSLTMMQFAERLADTEVGRVIASEGAARVNVIINDLTQKFDRFGAAATQRFIDRSRVWCVVLSFVVAFALNVDGLRLFKTFLMNDDARRALVGMQQEIATAATAADASFSAATNQTNEQKRDAQRQIEEVHTLLNKANRQIGGLTSVGVPIGYDYFPRCQKLADVTGGRGSGEAATTYVDGKCEGTAGGRYARQFAAWFVSVFITAILIGLGSPFWFDAVKNLSRSLQLLKSASGGSKPADDTAKTPVTALRTAATAPPQNPVEAFVTAIAAAPAGPLKRALLSPSGEVVRGI
jgi:hypothetical protein